MNIDVTELPTMIAQFFNNGLKAPINGLKAPINGLKAPINGLKAAIHILP
jgi:hypothetical protein